MKRMLVVMAALSASVVATANAAPITGSFTLGGDTVCAAGPALPCTMTSTDSTFSVLRFVLDTPAPFADITDLAYDYTSVLGGIGGGAPRVAVVTTGGTFLIHWGPAGSFVDPAVGPGSTGNLLALTDLGRYDLGGIGGSSYTDRAAALALAGTYEVSRFSLILDSFGGHDREFVIGNISASGDVAAVPEPGSIALLGVGLVGACFRRFRR